MITRWTQSSSPHCNLPVELEPIAQGLHLPARAHVEQDPSEQPPVTTESAEPAAPKEENEGEDTKAEEKELEQAAGGDGKEEEGEDEEETGPERVSLSMDEILRLSFFQVISFPFSNPHNETK